MLRAALLAVLVVTVGTAVAAEPAQAQVCPDFEPEVGTNTWRYACGRLACLEDGLPNIMVTCL